jgi:hypothetical protein
MEILRERLEKELNRAGAAISRRIRKNGDRQSGSNTLEQILVRPLGLS